ncbi:alpha/beta hydrolase [Oceanobacillus luteolus]|uniref:alpha/beta fold hydrolase n=1 Tax=Oceanobacillus luteolus TaxID=1274358 RepID=UPI00203FF207|nr:alpha/beta hydrolase [Oceanobacillus luteolus]MCM3739281.1 alpha/beta hydrolase [Oceanobacillus luteolus]
MKSLTKEIIRLSNMNIYCEHLLQDKPPIIFIHGFVSSVSTFRRVIPKLSDSHSIIAIDLPGFGKSEKSTTFTYTYENYGRLITACMDYFNLDKASIVGHSMGGQVALHSTILVPERIDKLVLIASSGYLDKARAWQRYASYLPFSAQVAKRFVHKKTVQQYLENVLYDTTFVSRDLIEAYSQPLQEKNFYKTLIRLLRFREGDLSSEQLKEIHQPVLLIWGLEDRVVPVQIGVRLSEDLPNSHLFTYEKAGHLITEEKSQEVSRNILSFLDG